MSPVRLANFQRAPALSFLISSGSTKKEPRYAFLTEAKASHSHKMWTEVSSSVPHFLQVELLLSPIIYKCLLKALCPVRRLYKTCEVFFLLADSTAPESYVPTFRDTLFHLHRWCCLHRRWSWKRQSVPKRRDIKFSLRGITQKKEYNNQNTKKVLNQG